ncbi:uncharacterized protein LOC110823223 [Carica papaya]|uniref:uncharacterized protein LOC110823223 n=1 Tax=Carica papaya TaxID=3649 RepID=UPI000B8CF549|nr:uncharacterized protein LOC110823223 [Carica papaya]
MGMDNKEGKSRSELKQRIFKIFKDFLTRVTKLEELGRVGSRLLLNFQEGLEFLRRPPINRTSELIEKILKVNETERLRSYIEAGGINSHDAVKSMDKLHICLHGLHDHVTKAKIMLSELECLLEDVESTMRTVNECPSPRDKEMNNGLENQVSMEKDEMTLYGPEESEITEFGILMGIIYSMLKQDYLMQERIVKALNLTSSSGELESYNLMWSLRPFVKDEIMHQAWRYIP